MPYEPRTNPKKRKAPEHLLEVIGSDVKHGVGKLKKQVGTAAEKVKSGAQKTLKYLSK